MAVALDEVWGRVKNVCKQNGLLILSVLAVVIGCLLGFFLRGKQLSEQVSWVEHHGGVNAPTSSHSIQLCSPCSKHRCNMLRRPASFSCLATAAGSVA